jgi:hypothetical protein
MLRLQKAPSRRGEILHAVRLGGNPTNGNAAPQTQAHQPSGSRDGVSSAGAGS